MKISYNWLKQLISFTETVEEVAAMLTNAGLEVESIEKYESVKGGLEGIVIGKVIEKQKHPNADKLSITKVDVGSTLPLTIVCGAGNVAEDQKVAVATVNTTLYPISGEPFQIKKSKIRGVESEGMICAEDEIGLGVSHEGIMVLDANAVVGSKAKEYFNIQTDYILEIGLTPNRADAASHMGVARDLVALLSIKTNAAIAIKNPLIDAFAINNTSKQIKVEVKDSDACPRYSGITISGVTIAESPKWLKNKLEAIGVRCINNIVDITNYVLHELGQPLHAFDADKIIGNTVEVKKMPSTTKFITLDGQEREINTNDLMICNAKEPMCIAGVFGGQQSGVTVNTKNLFLESAYFDPTHIRITSKHLGLKTDASFRYERGTDPNITVYALKRAALLIQEIAGGEITSDIVDIYPNPIKDFTLNFSIENCNKLIGKKIEKETIKKILTSLEIKILQENANALLLSIPPFKVDVTREADVVEEILRVYGYNNIETPTQVKTSIVQKPKVDSEKIQNKLSSTLASLGFSEILTNSLTKKNNYKADFFKEETLVKLANPLSSDLNIMRQTLLFGGLEVIAFNKNRKQEDLKLFEFGKTYTLSSKKYVEENHLSLFVTGNKMAENWNIKQSSSDFFFLKGFVNALLQDVCIKEYEVAESNNKLFNYALAYAVKNTSIVTFGEIKPEIAQQFDLKTSVFYADIHFDNLLRFVNNSVLYKEAPKYPEVKRDLALLIEDKITYEELKKIALSTEKKLLKKIDIFDYYKGDKIEAGKKSYALRFLFQDSESTLTDAKVDAIVKKLIDAYTKMPEQ